jgi:hypothetical protein
MVGGWLDLARKDAVADLCIEQHRREDEDALPPKREGEAGMRCRGFLDHDRQRDHVGPERDGQSAERCRENQRHHVERDSVPATANALGRHHYAVTPITSNPASGTYRSMLTGNAIF